VELIERRIYLIRGQKVMLDSDLADLYQVTTGNLNLAVRRNIDRFPEDFMFQLTKEENNSLLLQFARAKKGRGGRQTQPYAFTELGVAMLSSVLNSERAVQVNIVIMRAFVRLRELLATHNDLAPQNRPTGGQAERSRRAPGPGSQGHRDPGQKRDQRI
jgi:ORF6N domain-containing protein